MSQSEGADDEVRRQGEPDKTAHDGRDDKGSQTKLAAPEFTFQDEVE